jgi:hypothetical protein
VEAPSACSLGPQAGILSAGEVLATASGVGRHAVVAAIPVVGGVLEALVVRLGLGALVLAMRRWRQRQRIEQSG